MNQVTIAGGGLAGLSLGIALRSREVPVRLIEASTYPRHRVCGEFISGVTESELHSLGIADLFGEAQRHRGTSWHEGDRELLRAALPDDARGLSRHRLDALLVERLIALGGEVITNQRFSGGGEGVVLATGRPRRETHWIGLKAHYESLDLATPISGIMTSDLAWCTMADDVRDLATTMTQRRIRHVPVVEDGRLLAIVSIGDVVKHRLDELEAERDQLAGYVHG